MYNNKVDNVPLFRFDENGEYKTDDEKLIKKLKGRFDHRPFVEDTQDVVIEEETKEETQDIVAEENETVEANVIEDMNYNDLRKLAKDKGIEIKNPTKAELIERLEELN